MTINRFGFQVFRYVQELVPEWRVSDDVESFPNLVEDVRKQEAYVTGIRVLRRGGRDVLIVVIESLDDENILLLKQIAADRQSRQRLSRIVLVYDDALISGDDLAAQGLVDFAMVAWTKRSELTHFVAFESALGGS